MFYDPRRDDHGLPRDPFLALVAPRPIGWISTRSAAGIANLAPYSFFNAFSTDPHVVGFSATGRKDSLVNAAETGVFAVNVVSLALAEAMNRTSITAPPEIDEFALAGIAMAECRTIAAPCVAGAPAVLECRTVEVIAIRGAEGRASDARLVLGEVVGIRIDDGLIVDGRVDPLRLRPLGRLGYMDYAAVDQVFSMARPRPHDAESR